MDRVLAGRAERVGISGHGRWVEGIEAEVVVSAVDVASDEPASGTADDDVGGEVFVGQDAADADAGGGAVDGSTGYPTGVLFADDGGHGPCGCGVVRGKGGTGGRGGEEVSLGVVDEGSITTGDEFDDLGDGQGVAKGFAGEECGLVGLGCVVAEAPEVHAGGQGSEGDDASVGEGGEVLLVRGADVDVLRHGVVVAADEDAGGDREREQPLGIKWPDVDGAGPDGFLVGEQAAGGAEKGDVLWLGDAGGGGSRR